MKTTEQVLPLLFENKDTLLNRPAKQFVHRLMTVIGRDTGSDLFTTRSMALKPHQSCSLRRESKHKVQYIIVLPVLSKENPDIEAFIICHELAHIYLHHHAEFAQVSEKFSGVSVKQSHAITELFEHDADIFATTCLLWHHAAVLHDVGHIYSIACKVAAMATTRFEEFEIQRIVKAYWQTKQDHQITATGFLDNPQLTE